MATDNLLQTKLYVPAVRPSLVPRPRLINKLNAGLDRALSLICAPAGFGKTTLVVEWLQQLSADDSRFAAGRFAWLSLDENDNDPARFMTYLIAALQNSEAGIGERTLPLLEAPQPPPMETILTTLINEIAAVSHPVILVLDDYQIVQTAQIHQQLAFMFEHRPPQMHLVITTRADPLLPLARLRARGEMIELRETDLRFVSEEATHFLNRIMRLGLTSAQITTLNRRTEGWIAGLQLSALSMQGQEDIAEFITSFSGSHRFVLDYLTDEVLRQQPQEMRDFLLQTSILERLSGPLCDEVTGQKDGQVTLERLEQLGLFIIPLDQSRQWYRYHRLFAELLHFRLHTQQLWPEATLHQRAAQWYEEAGLLADAIHHILLAQDWEKGAALINRISDSMLKQGRLTTMINWCEQLPEDILRSQPALALSYIWTLLLIGRFDSAEQWLDEIETFAQEIPPLLGQVATAQAYLARARGENARVIEKSQQALALLPESELVSRGTLAMNLGLVYWHEGRLSDAKSLLEDARDIAQQIGNRFGQLTSEIFLARTVASQGELRRSQRMFQQILRQGNQIPILTLAHFDLCTLHYEWNELDEAKDQLDQGMQLCKLSGNVEFQNAGHMLRSSLLLAQRDARGALREVQASHKLAQDLNPATQSRSAASHAQLALALGDLETAVQQVERITEDVDPHPLYRFLGLTQPRLLIAQGQKAAAAAQLQARYETASQAGWGYAVIAVRVWQSLAAETRDQALAFLNEALELAAPEGYIRTFADAGEPLVPLLQEAAQRGYTPDYVGKILAAMRDKSRVQQVAAQISPQLLIEPLSDREIEVLRLVAAGLSNREIANKLTVSLGTAKSHIHNIYGKLQVRNRPQAIARAKELGLV